MSQLRPGGKFDSTSVLRHLDILRTVTEAVSRSLNLTEVLQKSVDALTHVTGHEIASLHLISADGETLLLRGERGLSERLREINRELRVGQGLIGGVALTGQARRLEEVIKADDLLDTARIAVARDGIRGFVCVPIRARHRVLGTLSLGRQVAPPFSDEEVALLEAAADQIGLALDNARLYSETRLELDDLRRSHTEAIRAERLAAVGELAQGVAHEINNPLTVILGQVQLLIQSGNVDEIVNGLKIIDSATMRAASIIRDLVLFARHTPLRPSPCRVADEITHVLSLEQTRLDAQRIAIRTEFEPAALIWADTKQLREVIEELVRNAVQAMVQAHGHGTLTIRVKPNGPGVQVEVADDGPGVPAQHLPRIFNPFFTTKAPGEGRGLGLSVAYSIITEHGGTIRVHNQPNAGASFVIELPQGAPAVELGVTA